jgi:hypothetical protein
MNNPAAGGPEGKDFLQFIVLELQSVKWVFSSIPGFFIQLA